MTNRAAVVIVAALGLLIIGEVGLLVSRYSSSLTASAPAQRSLGEVGPASPAEAPGEGGPAACIAALSACRQACQYDFDTNPAAEPEACFAGCEAAFQSCRQAG